MKKDFLLEGIFEQEINVTEKRNRHNDIAKVKGWNGQAGVIVLKADHLVQNGHKIRVITHWTTMTNRTNTLTSYRITRTFVETKAFLIAIYTEFEVYYAFKKQEFELYLKFN